MKSTQCVKHKKAEGGLTKTVESLSQGDQKAKTPPVSSECYFLHSLALYVKVYIYNCRTCYLTSYKKKLNSTPEGFIFRIKTFWETCSSGLMYPGKRRSAYSQIGIEP